MSDEYTVDNLDVLAPSAAAPPLLDEQQKPLAALGAKRAFWIFISFHLVQFLVAILAAIPFGVAAAMRAADPGEASGSSQALSESPAIVVVSLVAAVFAGFVALRMARRTLPGSIGSGALSTIGWARASKSQLTIAAAVGATIALFSYWRSSSGIFHRHPVRPGTSHQRGTVRRLAASPLGTADHRVCADRRVCSQGRTVFGPLEVVGNALGRAVRDGRIRACPSVRDPELLARLALRDGGPATASPSCGLKL